MFSPQARDSRPIAPGPAQAAPARAVKPRPLAKKSTLEPGKKDNGPNDRVSSAPEHTRTAATNQAPKRKSVELAELDPESEDRLERLPQGKLRKAKVEMEVQRRKQPARRGGHVTRSSLPTVNLHTIITTVVDRCATCGPNDIDLSPAAFEQFAPLSTGRVHDVNWRIL
ncbi:hypothetical protein GGX14DRAFT_566713 [Mycena pura]|uniref:Uncharacterized protein n=1 Tax=Mycena pura TaxID=153505 RepID=A0AAD6Y9C0_9AGAR|nr:hypothetical protein GGX14DRAFT_566713 [Mycena pura]